MTRAVRSLSESRGCHDGPGFGRYGERVLAWHGKQPKTKKGLDGSGGNRPTRRVQQTRKFEPRGASEALRRRFFIGTALDPVVRSDDPESRFRTYEAGNPDGTPARKCPVTVGMMGWEGNPLSLYNIPYYIGMVWYGRRGFQINPYGVRKSMHSLRGGPRTPNIFIRTTRRRARF